MKRVARLRQVATLEHGTGKHLRLFFFVLVLIGVGTGWSAAQRLHNSVNINACYKIRNGKLRLAGVNTDGSLFCRRGELPIQWPATCECVAVQEAADNGEAQTR